MGAIDNFMCPDMPAEKRIILDNQSMISPDRDYSSFEMLVGTCSDFQEITKADFCYDNDFV
jgi:hypothetical protein